MPREYRCIQSCRVQVIEDRLAESEQVGFEPTRMAFLDTLLSKMKDGSMTLADVQEEVDTFMFGVMISLEIIGRG